MCAAAYLLPLRSSPSAAAHWVLFPHAGGHANVFARWPLRLAKAMNVHGVQLPGRMGRCQEPFDQDFSATTRRIAAEIAALAPAPVHLFGHSLGGLLAYGCALQLQRIGVPARSLCLSGVAAPQHQRLRHVEGLSEAQVMDRIMAYGGIPDELQNDPELLAYFLKPLKADLRLLDSYSRSDCWPGERLMVPVHAFCGREDLAAGPFQMTGWADLAGAGFDLASFDGGHFYLLAAADALCGRLNVIASDDQDGQARVARGASASHSARQDR